MKNVSFKIPNENGELLEHVYNFEDIVIVDYKMVNDFKKVTENDIEYSKLYILNKSENTADPYFYYKRKDINRFINTGVEFSDIYNILRKDYMEEKDIIEAQKQLTEKEKDIIEKTKKDKKSENNSKLISPDCATCKLRSDCPIDYQMGSLKCMKIYDKII